MLCHGAACVCHVTFVQDLSFDARPLEVTVAARPKFIADRRTSLPRFVLAFALVTVFIIALLIGAWVSVQLECLCGRLDYRLPCAQRPPTMVLCSVSGQAARF